MTQDEMATALLQDGEAQCPVCGKRLSPANEAYIHATAPRKIYCGTPQCDGVITVLFYGEWPDND